MGKYPKEVFPMEQLAPLISALIEAILEGRLQAPHLLSRSGNGPGHRPHLKWPQTRPPSRPHGEP